jgi:hypothetical protein
MKHQSLSKGAIILNNNKINQIDWMCHKLQSYNYNLRQTNSKNLKTFMCI